MVGHGGELLQGQSVTGDLPPAGFDHFSSFDGSAGRPPSAQCRMLENIERCPKTDPSIILA
jgi:hypothetical protein